VNNLSDLCKLLIKILWIHSPFNCIVNNF
jgi:hypothetical protein